MSKLSSLSRLSLIAACMFVSRGAFAEDAPPKELKALRSSFAGAVAARDFKAAEALSRFPMPNRVKDAPNSIARADFARWVIMNDFWSHADCLARAPLTQSYNDDKTKVDWFVACDHGASLFHFGRVGGRWLFDGFEATR